MNIQKVWKKAAGQNLAENVEGGIKISDVGKKCFRDIPGGI